jgi:hypothetical protein
MIGSTSLAESALALGTVLQTGNWEQIALHARNVKSATVEIYQIFEQGRRQETEGDAVPADTHSLTAG